jgi:hypothetical protein
MNYLPKLSLILLYFFCANCSEKSDIIVLDVKQLYALNGDSAKYHLTKDQEEGFFENINKNEVALQMKSPPVDGEERTQMIQRYKQFLEQDVRDFNSADIDYINKVFVDLYKNPRLQELNMPDSLLLIKVAGTHYGNSVYYTRENCIIIPENVLQDKDESAFSGVMLHEIFHIFSRYNPTIKKELYELIGFTSIPNLTFEPNLKRRIIYNPDGLDMNWSIELSQNQKDILACPLILSKEKPNYRKGLFPNFEFKLYELKQIDENSMIVLSDASGNSTLNQTDIIKAYFDKIGTNTGYIIHPDEILADHFMMVMRGDTLNLNKEIFSGKNLELYNGVKSILLN